MMTRTVLGIVLMASAATVAIMGQAPDRRAPRNSSEFEELFQRVSNWGRWGPRDQIGSVNLVTADVRRRALSLVKEHTSVSLSHNSLTDRAEDNPSPFERSWNVARVQPLFETLTDTFKVSYHGVGQSHIDALCHVLFRDRSYNGYARSEVRTDAGCARLGIENLKDGVVTRGVLVDIPRLKGVPYLEPGIPVFVEDLEAWERMAGVRVGAGDAVLLRTGRWARRAKVGPWDALRHAAGLHASVAPWIKARGVAIIGSDVGSDVMPSQVEGVALPIHILMINALGINLLDNQDLEDLAGAAAKLKRWEFMLTIAPVPVSGGTGSPVNVLAMF